MTATLFAATVEMSLFKLGATILVPLALVLRRRRLSGPFNCSSGTFVEQARTEYGEGRDVVASYTVPTGQMNITRGSIAEKVRSIVCA